MHRISINRLARRELVSLSGPALLIIVTFIVSVASAQSRPMPCNEIRSREPANNRSDALPGDAQFRRAADELRQATSELNRARRELQDAVNDMRDATAQLRAQSRVYSEAVARLRNSRTNERSNQWTIERSPDGSYDLKKSVGNINGDRDAVPQGAPPLNIHYSSPGTASRGDVASPPSFPAASMPSAPSYVPYPTAPSNASGAARVDPSDSGGASRVNTGNSGGASRTNSGNSGGASRGNSDSK